MEAGIADEFAVLFPAREDSPWAFRIRFALPDRANLASPETELRISETEDVRMGGTRPADGRLNEAKQIPVIGRGYASEGDARAAAARWRAYLERAFARVAFPADFGDRAPGAVLTYAGRQLWEEQHGERILQDEWLMFFQEDPPPKLLRIGPPGISVGRSIAAVLGTIKKAAELDVSTTPRHVLAFDLYSASYWQPSEDSRFMMLMMALETLIDSQLRDPSVLAVVDELVAHTKASKVAQSEKASVLGTLEWLKVESISQAGRRLARTLGERSYNDQTPSQFFTDVYSIRSGLAHGHHPRPDVGGIVGELERFVGDLLSVELLDFDPRSLVDAAVEPPEEWSTLAPTLKPPNR